MNSTRLDFLQLLQVPEDRWQSFLMDFIYGLLTIASYLLTLAKRITSRKLNQDQKTRARVSSRLPAFEVVCDSRTGKLQPALAPSRSSGSTTIDRHSPGRRYLGVVAAPRGWR
jgi:hypothetical protein